MAILSQHQYKSFAWKVWWICASNHYCSHRFQFRKYFNSIENLIGCLLDGFWQFDLLFIDCKMKRSIVSKDSKSIREHCCDDVMISCRSRYSSNRQEKKKLSAIHLELSTRSCCKSSEKLTQTKWHNVMQELNRWIIDLQSKWKKIIHVAIDCSAKLKPMQKKLNYYTGLSLVTVRWVFNLCADRNDRKLHFICFSGMFFSLQFVFIDLLWKCVRCKIIVVFAERMVFCMMVFVQNMY